jgi:hypothetical protein
MEETKPVPKPAVSDEEIYRRSVDKMSNRQMSGHLRRLTRKSQSPSNSTWAIVLSTIFDNTAMRGKPAPYLR